MSVKILDDPETIVQVSGDIDIANVQELAESLQKATELAAQGFIVDLSGVTYIDSAGIKVIFAVHSKIRELGGSLAVVAANTHVRRMLDLVHLELLPGLCVCNDLEEARQFLEPFAKPAM